MPRQFQFSLKWWLSIAGFFAIPVAVLLTDRLNSRQKIGAIATCLLIGVLELAKYLRSK